ncbi:hypothetical protein [Clostridium sp. UBA3061]|uniref:hypothetical protein n=1 Tax=Clostridium sp. UBA3061 TaxID=1946353 RepID=UPI003217476C
MSNTLDRIKKYKELKADIVDINIRMEELEEEVVGISAQPQGERTSQTYKITSSVEQQAEKLMEKKDELLKIKAGKERELDRIDNALTVLTDEERDIIETVYIEHKKYWKLEERLNKTYARLKQIEKVAIRKMSKYIP